LAARSYPDAAAIHRKHAGKGLSKQSFHIMDKIREVDELLTPVMQMRIREIHPEVTFCVLNKNRPLRHNKKTLAGRNERIALLAGIFPSATRVIQGIGRGPAAGADDILDALAAAWTAAQAALGQAATLPEQPERDGKGLRMEILKPFAGP
jgi:predicted RNase H-like nuclease